MTNSHEGMLLELLNAIHEDGGSHTHKVGLLVSVEHAITRIRTLKGHSEALGILRNDFDAMKIRLREVEQEEEETFGTLQRTGTLLRDTAVAIHGGPMANGFWSHHDLPELAALMRRRASPELPIDAIETSRQILARLGNGNG